MNITEAKVQLTWEEKALEHLERKRRDPPIKLNATSEPVEVEHPESGEMVWRRIPADDVMMVVAAYTYTCRFNADRKFIQEFARIMKKQGHEIVLEQAREPEDEEEKEDRQKMKDLIEERDDAHTRAKKLAGAADFKDEESFQAAAARVEDMRASEEDKLMLARHYYKSAWGIAQFTEKFAKENGDAQIDQTHQLYNVCKDPRVQEYKRGGGTSTSILNGSKQVLVAEMVAEFVAKLGLQSPLDTDTEIEGDIAEIFEERVKNTYVVQNWNIDRKTRAMFVGNPRRLTNLTEGDKRQTANALINCVLGQVGVRLIQLRKGNKSKGETALYALDPESVKEAAERFHMKFWRRLGEAEKREKFFATIANEHARDYLMRFVPTKYEALKRPLGPPATAPDASCEQIEVAPVAPGPAMGRPFFD
jgi:hypothetical protein